MLVIRHQLVDCSSPRVMGIINVTPDSFAQHCTTITSSSVLAMCARLIDQGADWLDIGACSTRPGGELVDEEEEKRRLDIALKVVRRVYPNCCISVDTFRASIAQYVIENYRVNLINDVSGLSDTAMTEVIVRARVPYILSYPLDLNDNFLLFFARKLDYLHKAGVSDVIVDPGLGFGKSVDQNFATLRCLPLLRHLQVPILVGLSRKSMIYKTLQVTPQEALNGTTAAHMLALMNGADILRVHDVKEAKQTINIWNRYSR